MLERFGGKGVVEIDLSKAGNFVDRVVDLTDPVQRNQHLTGWRANNWATYWEEVLIDGWISPGAVKWIQ